MIDHVRSVMIVTVTFGGETLLAGVNPLNAFVGHQVTFTARGSSGVLRIQNTGTAGDSTAFVDEISMCVEQQQCANLPNGDFERDQHGTFYDYRPPASWTRNAVNSVIAMNGNGEQRTPRVPLPV